MNTYGFLPSAFGSLYVDLKFIGLIPCAAVGLSDRHRLSPRSSIGARTPAGCWLTPFVSLGIIISLNNTPIGLSNGLMLHIWLLAAFFLAKPHRLRAQAPVRPTGG
jgi:hypothetical protein